MKPHKRMRIGPKYHAPRVISKRDRFISVFVSFDEYGAMYILYIHESNCQHQQSTKELSCEICERCVQ